MPIQGESLHFRPAQHFGHFSLDAIHGVLGRKEYFTTKPKDTKKEEAGAVRVVSG
jgi:hypothetical protein